MSDSNTERGIDVVDAAISVRDRVRTGGTQVIIVRDSALDQEIKHEFERLDQATERLRNAQVFEPLPAKR